MAGEGPDGDPIPTLSMCLSKILLNIKMLLFGWERQEIYKFAFFQTMNNVVVFKNTVSGNFHDSISKQPL